MRALCPTCGLHHEVVRVLENGYGDERHDLYQIAPLEDCPQTMLSDRDILDAAARFGEEAILQEDLDDLG